MLAAIVYSALLDVLVEDTKDPPKRRQSSGAGKWTGHAMAILAATSSDARRAAMAILKQ